MHRLSPATEALRSSRPSALRLVLPGAFLFLTGLALAGAPALAAEPPGSVAAQAASAPRTESLQVTLTAPGPGFTVRSATPKKGITGQIREAGTSITFKSRKIGPSVTASISRADGTVLYGYREFNGETTTVQGRDGSRIALPRAPELRVKGVLYLSSTPELLGALRSLAASPDGGLIRRLGLELVFAAPDPRLADERRGLELAAQALWPHFAPDGPSAPPLTADYEVGGRGYVVLSQPEGLVLAINHTGPANPWEKHDDGAVGDCLGRCGSGCTGGLPIVGNIWPSYWTDTSIPTYGYHQEVRCISGEDWVYTTYASPITHSLDGWWHPACQLHDDCCRMGDILCYTYCNALLPSVGLYLLVDGLGEVRNWSYTEYNWSFTYYNAGYSGCTCPGQPPYQDDYECVEG